MQTTLDQDYAALLAAEKPAEPSRPRGWYRFYGSDGVEHGLGFYCGKCHLCVEPNAPDEIFHCGKKDEVGFLKRLASLPKFKMKQFVL